jgi:GGDEF domain-containing protein
MRSYSTIWQFFIEKAALAMLMAIPVWAASQRGGPEAFAIAESMRMAVTDLAIPNPNSPLSRHLTISAGVASIRAWDGGSPAALIKMADQALYQAKLLGRDRLSRGKQPGQFGGQLIPIGSDSCPG